MQRSHWLFSLLLMWFILTIFPLLNQRFPAADAKWPAVERKREGRVDLASAVPTARVPG